MISALEIGFALSAPLLVLAFVLGRPKSKPVPVRVRRVEPRPRSQV